MPPVGSQPGLSSKGKSLALGRPHLTSAELCSPVGGSVGSAAEQSAGCHEKDLPAAGRGGWGRGRICALGEGRDSKPSDLEG